MTRDDIIRMALEAGFLIDGVQEFVFARSSFHFTDELTSFAALVAAAAKAEENEACAKVCDDKAMHCETKAQEAIEAGEHDEASAIRSTAWQISICAAAIRARGETK